MHRSLVRLGICAVIGLLAGIALSSLTAVTAILGGWSVAAVVFVGWTWLMLARLDAAATKRYASHEDPTHAVSLALVVVASIASVAGVVTLLAQTSSRTGAGSAAVVAVTSVVGAWTLVHTIYSVHYARAFYAVREPGRPAPIEFGGDDDPDFVDFAYLGFTLGMTYQVSDNTIRERSIRRDVLKHCLLSYLLGAVVVACTVNLVITLAS